MSEPIITVGSKGYLISITDEQIAKVFPVRYQEGWQDALKELERKVDEQYGA